MERPILLTVRDAAAYLKVQPQTLRAWRHRGTGPTFVKYNSRCVRYHRAALDAWLTKCETLPSAADNAKG